jgi:hypothetical protein
MFKFQRSQELDELFPLTYTEPSIASFFKSVPVRGSVVKLIYLADQLTRGFQLVDNQF